MKALFLILCSIFLTNSAFAVVCSGSYSVHIAAYTSNDGIGEIKKWYGTSYGTTHTRVKAHNETFSQNIEAPNSLTNVLQAVPYLENYCRGIDGYISGSASISSCAFSKPKPEYKPARKVAQKSLKTETDDLKASVELIEKLKARITELEKIKSTKNKPNVNDTDRANPKKEVLIDSSGVEHIAPTTISK